MRNFVLPLVFLFLLFTSPRCAKNTACTPKTAASEAPQIQGYATANNINAVAHSSGLYYEIIDPGTGAMPTINSNIAITYTGMLLNGTVFAQQTSPNNTQADPPWPLSALIEGWRIGIPLIKKGGRIKLIIPSSLAYGCTGKGAIPGNSILFFDITLVDVQ
ncbi:MAG: FKBP-type peptidyl-prolyl cis-trans isomerase [Bacteroidota bacterium]|nr:FKBP-type peptidyl-prolyl cis-trans isomerase [Bacteroidota bacterium]